jgi:predicted hotdog family 3-hydroxylacyl-ACP dehydratase
MQSGEVNILDILPQRPPFVMIDRIIYFDNLRTKTSFIIRSENIFFDNGRLNEAGLSENMAQTCAARIGYINKELEGESVKLGYIGSMKNVEIRRLPEEGEEIVTEINVLEEIFKMTLVSVSVSSPHGIIAEGEMKIFITDINKTDE